MVNRLPLDAELHRQVHPDLFKMDGSVMSSAFVPKTNDHDKLSTRQASLMTPEGAFNFHASLGLSSAGTWTFAVRDVEPAEVLDDASGDDAHASVCFDHCSSRGARERLGKKIRAAARQTFRAAA